MLKNTLISVGLFLSLSANSATLVISGGQLEGATDVNVDGTLYDVEFLNGSCVDQYDGCDELSDLDFNSAADAVLATQALMDQVFLDGPSGNFDTAPINILGCDAATICVAFVPYAISTYFGGPGVNTKYAYNDSDEGTDWSGGNNNNNALTDYPGSSGVYARFAVSSVPIPPAAILFGSSLALLGWMRRKKA